MCPCSRSSSWPWQLVSVWSSLGACLDQARLDGVHLTRDWAGSARRVVVARSCSWAVGHRWWTPSLPRSGWGLPWDVKGGAFSSPPGGWWPWQRTTGGGTSAGAGLRDLGCRGGDPGWCGSAVGSATSNKASVVTIIHGYAGNEVRGDERSWWLRQ